MLIKKHVEKRYIDGLPHPGPKYPDIELLGLLRSSSSATPRTSCGTERFELYRINSKVSRVRYVSSGETWYIIEVGYRYAYRPTEKATHRTWNNIFNHLLRFGLT